VALGRADGETLPLRALGEGETAALIDGDGDADEETGDAVTDGVTDAERVFVGERDGLTDGDEESRTEYTSDDTMHSSDEAEFALAVAP